MSIPGQAYLLTTTVRHRQCLFADLAFARSTSRIIALPTTWGDAQLLAWVLMPDHWHGLVQLGDEPLDRVMNRFKAAVTRELHRSTGFGERVWDRSFHDHALRSDEDVRRTARYIVANPVRARLVQHVLDYPYWDAIWIGSEVL